MPRTARIVIPEIPHHATQRGHNRQAVFFVDDDRRATQPADPEKIQQPYPQGYGYIRCNSITFPSSYWDPLFVGDESYYNSPHWWFVIA